MPLSASVEAVRRADSDELASFLPILAAKQRKLEQLEAEAVARLKAIEAKLVRVVRGAADR